MSETTARRSSAGTSSILHAIFKTAKREELVESNPAERAERPKLPKRRWRILEPVEVARVAKAFTDEQARVVFLTLVLTGVRRSELQALRWRDVDLVEGVLRVRDSKTEDGIRSIALPPTLQRSCGSTAADRAFQGDGRARLLPPRAGHGLPRRDVRGGSESRSSRGRDRGHVRPFHDLRHTAITNDAAAGASPIAVMTKAGHADMKTTQTYLHLAGVVFRDEAERLELRLLGRRGRKFYRSQLIGPDPR